MLTEDALRPGLRVVCTDLGFPFLDEPSMSECRHPRLGGEYTVRDQDATYPGMVGIRLAELPNPVLLYDMGRMVEPTFPLACFREADAATIPGSGDAEHAFRRIAARTLREQGCPEAELGTRVEALLRLPMASFSMLDRLPMS